MGWTAGISNPSAGEVFCALQFGPDAHPDFCTVRTISFSEGKQPERGADHPPSSTAGLRMGLTTISRYPVRLHWYVKDRPLPHTPCKVYSTCYHDLSVIKPFVLLLFMLYGQ